MGKNDTESITGKSWTFIAAILTSILAAWILAKYPNFSDVPFEWIIPFMLLGVSIYLLKTLRKAQKIDEYVHVVFVVLAISLSISSFFLLRPTKAESLLAGLRLICQDKAIWGGGEPAYYDQSFNYMKENKEQYVAGGWGDWAQEETDWVSLKSLAMGGFTMAGKSVGSVGAVNWAAVAGPSEQILEIRRLDVEELEMVGGVKVPRNPFDVSDLVSDPLSIEGDAKEYVHCNIPLRPMAYFEKGDLVFFRGAMIASGVGPSITENGIEDVPVSYVRCAGVERITPLG